MDIFPDAADVGTNAAENFSDASALLTNELVPRAIARDPLADAREIHHEARMVDQPSTLNL